MRPGNGVSATRGGAVLLRCKPPVRLVAKSKVMAQHRRVLHKRGRRGLLVAHLASALVLGRDDVRLSSANGEGTIGCFGLQRSRQRTRGTVVAKNSYPPQYKISGDILERIGRAKWPKKALKHALCQLFLRSFHPKKRYTDELTSAISLTDYVNANQTDLASLIGGDPFKELLEWSACSWSKLLRQLRITEALGVSDIGERRDLTRIVSQWSDDISQFHRAYTKFWALQRLEVQNDVQLTEVGRLLQAAETAVRKTAAGLAIDQGRLDRRRGVQKFAKAVSVKIFKLINPSKGRRTNITSTGVLHQIMNDKELWTKQPQELKRWEEILRPTEVGKLKGLTELLVSCFKSCRFPDWLRTGFLQEDENEPIYATIDEAATCAPQYRAPVMSQTPLATRVVHSTVGRAKPTAPLLPVDPTCPGGAVAYSAAGDGNFFGPQPLGLANPNYLGGGVANSTAGSGNFFGSRQPGNGLFETQQPLTLSRNLQETQVPPLWGPSTSLQSEMVRRSAFAVIPTVSNQAKTSQQPLYFSQPGVRQQPTYFSPPVSATGGAA